MPKGDRVSRERFHWVDYTKGLAIALVVFYHVLAGLLESSILDRTWTVTLIMDFLWAFGMSMFFFLTGLFAGRAAQYPLKMVLVDRFKVILYPYLVWATLQVLVQASFSHFTNQPRSFGRLLSIPYDPPGQFWFLYTLFLIMVIHACAARLRIRSGAFLALAVGFYLTAYWFRMEFWNVLYAVRAYTMYFALGAVFAEAGLARLPDQAKISLVVGGCVLGFGANLLMVLARWPDSRALGPLVALCGSVGLICAAILLERSRVCGFVETWGGLSLEIYAAHVFAIAAVRILLQRLTGCQLSVVHVVVGVLAGIYGPVLLYRLCQRIGFRYMFSLRPRGSAVRLAGPKPAMPSAAEPS
jgi:fucose 4-O-acetylase-like acetyltransferase